MSGITDYVNKIKFDKKDWKKYPILLRWLEQGKMTAEIGIISKKIEYLLSLGAKSKVKEWISSDKALTQITAERYLLDYLRNKNTNYEDMFSGGGVDGYLNISGSKIGIEVTTINQSLPEWILVERLLTYLSVNNYKNDIGIEISYDLSKLENIKYGSLDIIQQIGSAILRNNFHGISGISLKKISKRGSYISWNNTESDINFFTNIQYCLTQIINDKNKQINKNQQNILFVCVGQLPTGIFNPGIFKELGGKVYHQDWIDELEQIVTRTLPVKVLGVCFFTYTLPFESMMYPLKIIWRDKTKTIPINV